MARAVVIVVEAEGDLELRRMKQKGMPHNEALLQSSRVWPVDFSSVLGSCTVSC